MPPTAADVKVNDVIKIASYALNALPLALWIGTLGRVLISKDRRKFTDIIIISILMILTQVTEIVVYQLFYTQSYRAYNGDQNHNELVQQTMNVCAFISDTTFYLAHWVFAFSYLALSYRLDLVSTRLP